MIKQQPITPEVLARLPDLVETLRACDSVQALFFFGGLAEGKLQPLSDLDLAVLVRPGKVGDELFDLQLELIGIVSQQLKCEEFDLVVLNLAPMRFAYQILKQGWLIFVKDLEELVDFRERVVKRYLDFAHYRKSFDRVFMQGLGLHG